MPRSDELFGGAVPAEVPVAASRQEEHLSAMRHAIRDPGHARTNSDNA